LLRRIEEEPGTQRSALRSYTASAATPGGLPPTAASAARRTAARGIPSRGA
jgi:hypothetical protein